MTIATTTAPETATRRARAERALERLENYDAHEYGDATIRRVAKIVHQTLRNTPTIGSRAAARALSIAASSYTRWQDRPRHLARAQRLIERDAHRVLDGNERIAGVIIDLACYTAVAVMPSRHGTRIFVGRPTDYGDLESSAMTWQEIGTSYQRAECKEDWWAKRSSYIADTGRI